MVGTESAKSLMAETQSLYITSATFDWSVEVPRLAQIVRGREESQYPIAEMHGQGGMIHLGPLS